MHRKQLGPEDSVFMRRIAAYICQLSITITKYMKQVNYEEKSLFPSQFRRFKDIVTQFW